MKQLLSALVVLGAAAPAFAQGQMVITELTYQSQTGGIEFVEFTNIGNAPVDMTGWSYDDNSFNAGTIDLSAFGTVAAGESVVLCEDPANDFRLIWGLPATVKVIGGNSANLGRNDGVGLYDATLTEVDRIEYGDEDFPSSPRARNMTLWPYAEVIGQNNIYGWAQSSVGDAQGSYQIPFPPIEDVGNPGTFTSVGAGDDLIYLNEVYLNMSGTDNEFIEVRGVPGASTNDLMFLVVESDSSSATGTLDLVQDLSGFTFNANGLFTIGDAPVANLDATKGSQDIENSSGTLYLIRANSPAAVAALQGTDVSTGADTTLISTLGTIIDIVAVMDGGVETAGDVAFDGAPVLGPDAASFMPGGVYRDPTFYGDWCDGFLDFDPLGNAQPNTPGAHNAPCFIDSYGAGCVGSNGLVPRLQMTGNQVAGGTAGIGVYNGLPNELAILALSADSAETPVGSCTLLVALPAVFFPVTLDANGSFSISATVPAIVEDGELFVQALTNDPAAADGYATSNGVSFEILAP
ncbi:MAG: lamin tail domain-containing protein [Planctomycetota bacterium JB042]